MTIRRIIAGMAALCLLAALTPVTRAESAGEPLYLTPELADGVTLADDLANLYVVGVDNGDNTFTFTETRTVTLSVRAEPGWRINKTYSTFLSSFTLSEKDGVTTFSATARKDVTVDNSVLRAICINTTPEKLPRLDLEIDGAFSSVTRETWVDCTVRLTLGTKKYESGDYVGKGKVKGRGNSSWLLPEKPYSINFDKNVSLLDIPANKKYCILTTSYDKSMVRNLAVYAAAQELDGIDYTVRAEPCEVYLNGTYAGVYTLAERIRISKTKIQAEAATPENVTGAYLIEKTVGSKLKKDEVGFMSPYFAIPNGWYDYFTFADPDEVSDEMAAYVKNAVFAAHDAIMSESQTAYLDYVDVASFLDFMILQEIVKNIDGGMKTSTFLLLPAGSQKFEFTAPWDFDLALGLYAGDNNGEGTNSEGKHAVVTDSTKGNETEGFIAICQSAPWFAALYAKPAFRAALEERYTYLRYTFAETLAKKINYYAAYHDDALIGHESYRTKSTADLYVSSMKRWLTKRLAWLDTQWLHSELIPPAAGYGLLPGDVARNGVVSADDLTKLARFLAGIDTYLDVTAHTLADFDGNEEVTSEDLTLLARAVAGIA